MNKSKDFERLWCHKDFKKLIKIEATKRGLNIKEYTEILAKNEDDFIKNDKKKWKFKI